ncbi:metallo-beta-lactamase family protein [Sphingomonas sp. YR710]|jgi:metallo-beta-lactamase family protein|uniref:MBL fold metallo-hydrolase RNA specificity domain-containing protein n=1 Tax=Sphingomonas sp. YR710 TaxID=1882773 RepID=UPI0008918D9E|nr:MBL fold metallo-hydrolase [Sphingomonas sp. YR710]SDD12472.1 metallo-beta-lactamase family protein [Sphingomonas sp. YR710]
MAIDLTFHGAAQTVTGSCIELACGKQRLLVDCGLFQGARSLEALNHEGFPFDVSAIDAVILTHAHIDHSGLLPRLAADGYKGPIWCTAPTRDLIGYMLADSAHIQESDALHHNKRRDRADEAEREPLYTVADAEAAVALVQTVALDTWFDPAPGIRARLWNAGHILGSASIELVADGVSLLCSGDIGPVARALQEASSGPAGMDHVICESTYGDRDRNDLDPARRQLLLRDEIQSALAAGGNLIIPVFAVERTQELLFDMAALFESGALAEHQVFIDSPLATRATDVFLHADLPGTRDGAVFHHPAFHFTATTAESVRLNSTSGAIIMAGSGMCEGGRVRHHLIHNLAREDSTILFVGYQAKGSLGRTIVDGARRVRISGEDLAVKARIRRIDSYSAHADREDLLAWIAARKPIHGTLFLNHGETEAIAALGEACEGIDLRKPAIGEIYRLEAGKPARRLSTGDPAIQAVVSGDWQNAYADFAVNLKRDLQRIHDDAARQRAIAQMRRILDEFAVHRAEHRDASASRRTRPPARHRHQR